MSIYRESWYREAMFDEEYQKAYRAWVRSPERPTDKDLDITALENLLRLHQRIGKPPEEAQRYLLQLFWDDIKEIPLDFLPPVSFQIRFWIERYVDTTFHGVVARGYLTPSGEVVEEEGESTRHTMSVDAFFEKLDKEDWDSTVWGEWGHGSEDGPGIELEDHIEADEQKLQQLSMPLFHLRNQVDANITYLDIDPEDEEGYSEDLGGWKVALMMVPLRPSDYFQEVVDWAGEAGKL